MITWLWTEVVFILRQRMTQAICNVSLNRQCSLRQYHTNCHVRVTRPYNTAVNAVIISFVSNCRQRKMIEITMSAIIMMMIIIMKMTIILWGRCCGMSLRRCTSTSSSAIATDRLNNRQNRRKIDRTVDSYYRNCPIICNKTRFR